MKATCFMFPDNKPPSRGPYLVYGPGFGQWIAAVFEQGLWLACGGHGPLFANVTHFREMPLPPAPATRQTTERVEVTP